MKSKYVRTGGPVEIGLGLKTRVTCTGGKVEVQRRLTINLPERRARRDKADGGNKKKKDSTRQRARRVSYVEARSGEPRPFQFDLQVISTAK